MFITGPRGDYLHILSSLNIIDRSEASVKYFINFSRTENNNWLRDENGVILRNLGGKIGLSYNPINIGNLALGTHQLYLETREDKYRKIFLDQAEWFVQNQREKSGIGSVWKFDYDWILGIKSP